MDGFPYQLQLVGGPDDGATFHTTELPPFWEMLKKRDQIACILMGSDASLASDRYWRSDKVTDEGIVLYYHEGVYGDLAIL